ncbi:MAG: hypothetical protein JW778_07890 [Candidatus Altiarchaeota archaeon]|nr:hypothetical protein [Candidatus Altiarchaeota archaeon]
MAHRIPLLVILFLVAASADAARVGVVVEFPNGGVFMKCVDVDGGENAYRVMQETELPITWTEHENGHSLCAILDTGCLDTGCVCKTKYWNFYVNHGRGWTHSSVGLDGGPSCEEHYCARDRDMIGFTYDAYDKKPPGIGYREVCPEEKTEEMEEPDIMGRVISYPTENAGYITAIILLLLLTAYFIYKPWNYI